LLFSQLSLGIIGSGYFSYNGGGGKYFVYQTTQSMINIATAGRRPALYTEWSTKWVHSILSQTTCTTIMRHASCVTSNHVVQKWWCPQGMIVRLVGPKSIMVTWWQLIMAIKVFATLSVLTGKLSMCLAPNLIKMAHCCFLCKEAVAPYHASHTSTGESWRAPFVPNKQLKFQSIPVKIESFPVFNKNSPVPTCFLVTGVWTQCRWWHDWTRQTVYSL